jgi:hypothetical protein
MKVTKANLIRLNKTERSGHIRGSQTINGYFKENPIIGKGFCFFAESYTREGSFRLIETSYVEQITKDGFITETGSVYKIEQLGFDEV